MYKLAPEKRIAMKHQIFLLIVTLLVLTACEAAKDVIEVTRPVVPPTIQSATPTSSVILPKKRFQLKAPESEILLQLLMNPFRMPDSFANALKLTPITVPEPLTNDPGQIAQYFHFVDSYSEALGNDFKRYYPQEIPGAAVFLFPHPSFLGNPSHLFGRGVIDFLNTYGHSLEISKEQEIIITTDPFWYRGTIILKSVPMQLDSDLDIELLIYAYTDAPPNIGAFIPVNVTKQNSLQIIPNDLDALYELGCWQFDITHDLSRDRQNDILFYCDLPRPGFSLSSQIVFSWNEDGVFRIGETETIFWRGKQKPYEIEVTDIDSDGFEEIVWFINCEEGSVLPCEIANTFSWEGASLDDEEPTLVSGIPSNCEQFDNSFRVGGALNLCISQLSNSILTQPDPDIATKITDLLVYLPNDDPEAQPYIEHLTYLLGYYYELSGDAANAVSTYLSLIQQAPTSPWSWLAWARLEPVEE
jgi:hypothetical protein